MNAGQGRGGGQRVVAVVCQAVKEVAVGEVAADEPALELRVARAEGQHGTRVVEDGP
jgi:hypothetical protein